MTEIHLFSQTNDEANNCADKKKTQKKIQQQNLMKDYPKISSVCLDIIIKQA